MPDDWAEKPELTEHEASLKFLQAKVAFDANDFESARETWFELYQTTRGDVDLEHGRIAYFIGQCDWHLGNPTSAISWFEEAMALPGTAADVKALAEEALRGVRLQQDGVATPAAMDDHEIRTRLQQALAAYHEQRYDDALTGFTTLYESSRGGEKGAQPRLAYYIGLSLVALQRGDEALTWFEEAAHHPDASADVQSGAEESIRWLRDAGGTIDDSTPAIFTVDDAQKALKDAGADLIGGQFDHAISLAQDVLSSSAGSMASIRAEAAIVIGDALRNLGKYDDAVAWYEDALGVAGGDADLTHRAEEGLRGARIHTTENEYHSDSGL